MCLTLFRAPHGLGSADDGSTSHLPDDRLPVPESVIADSTYRETSVGIFARAGRVRRTLWIVRHLSIPHGVALSHARDQPRSEVEQCAHKASAASSVYQICDAHHYNAAIRELDDSSLDVIPLNCM